jgi:glycosyltransferase involved in cell wall biosynthesis
LGEVESIPEALRSSSIAVFPFQSGAGIKNKVLEAAAMEKSILISSIAVNGLMGDYRRCMRVVDSGESWVSSIIEQMNDPQRVRDNGQKARDWVIDCHSWGRSAKIAIDSLQ